MKLLRTVFWIEMVLVVLTATWLLLTPQNLMSLMLLVNWVPVWGLLTVFAVWQMIKYPQRRKLAIYIIVLPVAGIIVSITIQNLLGGPIDEGVFLYLVGAAFLLALVLYPKRLAKALPAGWFESRRFNRGLLWTIGLLLFAWVFPVIVLWALSSASDSGRQPLDLRGDPIVFLALYYLVGGVASLVLGLPGLLYAFLGLFQDHGLFKFHVAQLAGSAMLLLTLIPAGLLVVLAFTSIG